MPFVSKTTTDQSQDAHEGDPPTLPQHNLITSVPPANAAATTIMSSTPPTTIPAANSFDLESVSGDAMNHSDHISDDASTFTFHPVDAPDLEVIVSRIFSISFTTRQGIIPSPTAVSDEEDLSSSSDNGDDWFFSNCSDDAEDLLSPVDVGPLLGDSENVAIREEVAETDEADEREDDEDSFESRKRKEEAQLDEEQLHKKRRVEELERKARNELWKQSIKRSMFQHTSTSSGDQ